MSDQTAARVGRALTGLRPYVNRLSHITVNVTDLERSRAFWEATFPVRAVARTGGTIQAFPSLGIDEGQFVGWMLEDVSPNKGRGVHLVQWLDPTPTGVPYQGAFDLGWYRACALSDDVPARYQAVLAAGGRPFAEPRQPFRVGGRDTQRFTFAFRDPDGIVLEWVTDTPRLGGSPHTLYHVAAHCSDLVQSYHFYTDVLGLDLQLRTQPSEPRPASQLPAFGPPYDGDLFYEAIFMCQRSDTRNPIDLLEWIEPTPKGGPYISPFNIGIVRLALEVDDIDAAYDALTTSSETFDMIVQGPPEEWNMGDLGVRRVVVFYDADGLGYELIERPPYAAEVDEDHDRYRSELGTR